MRATVGLLVATLAIGGAHAARYTIGARPHELEEPYAPSAAAAPFVTLGYREAAADLLFIRLSGYFGSYRSTAEAVATLVEAIVALDPHQHRIYDYGAMVMSYANSGVTQDIYLRALAVLEKGAAMFPEDWKIPSLAGEIYTQDLVTTDPAQRRIWDEKGTLLTEAAVRKPGAPAQAATWVATMRTKLGQHDRAVRDLREIILVTSDVDARARLLDKLAKLEDSDAAEIAAEVAEERRRFDEVWLRERPMIRPTMYLLVGPHAQPGFDLGDLAIGGAGIATIDPIEKLPPLE